MKIRKRRARARHTLRVLYSSSKRTINPPRQIKRETEREREKISVGHNATRYRRPAALGHFPGLSCFSFFLSSSSSSSFLLFILLLQDACLRPRFIFPLPPARASCRHFRGGSGLPFLKRKINERGFLRPCAALLYVISGLSLLQPVIMTRLIARKARIIENVARRALPQLSPGTFARERKIRLFSPSWCASLRATRGPL